MTDNLRSYHIIRQGLEQLYPTRLTASQLRMLRTLCLIIHGLIASSHCHLSQIARKMPVGYGSKGKLESRTKQVARLMANKKLTTETFWLPYAQPLLAALTHQEGRVLKISLDGSAMGQGCMTLMASVVYAGRALPIGWLVVKGKKGHLAQERHLELVQSIYQLVGPTPKVLVLGDGEFDGTLLLARLQEYGWEYVVRTAKNSIVYDGGRRFNLAALEVRSGEVKSVSQAEFSDEKYGPVLALAVWERGYAKPLYLISNLAEPYGVAFEYKRRFRIECFFSDSKTRGFKLDKSHLSDPERLNRLLIGAVLTYWWLTYLGVTGRTKDWDKFVHRGDRTDLSFFQLGWRILEEFLRCKREIPFGLALLPQAFF